MAHGPFETSYIHELSTCLIKSLVHILERKPSDPIEYLAFSLQHYRRLHPVDSQCRQQKQIFHWKQLAHTNSFDVPFLTNIIDKSSETTNLLCQKRVFQHEEQNDCFLSKESIEYKMKEHLFEGNDDFPCNSKLSAEDLDLIQASFKDEKSKGIAMRISSCSMFVHRDCLYQNVDDLFDDDDIL